MQQEVNKMRSINFVFLSTLLFFFLFNSCTDESSTNPAAELKTVRVDLQSGFAGFDIVIKSKDVTVYHAQLSESVPFAGPLGTFTTSLPKGNNKLVIFWTLTNQYLNESIEFELEDNDTYFISIQLVEGKIDFKIQNSPFIYA